MADNHQIANAVSTILTAIGEDPTRDGLRDTPDRVARMYAEVFSGIDQDPAAVLSTTFEQPYDEMIVVRDIPFQSMCEHHLMPFIGRADVAYIPRDRVVGLSKLAPAGRPPFPPPPDSGAVYLRDRGLHRAGSRPPRGGRAHRGGAPLA